MGINFLDAARTMKKIDKYLLVANGLVIIAAPVLLSQQGPLTPQEIEIVPTQPEGMLVVTPNAPAEFAIVLGGGLADLNYNGIAKDANDFEIMYYCLIGAKANSEYIDFRCERVDYDKDNDVDLNDFGVFQRE